MTKKQNVYSFVCVLAPEVFNLHTKLGLC